MGYKIFKTEVSEQKIKAYSQLLSEVFTNTNKFSTAFLYWQYKQNPVGTVVGCDAYDGDFLAAHYVAIPVVYSINGKETKGLLSLNTVTHSNHQGKGLFTQLAKQAYEDGKTAGYEFVIGVANQNSTPGFLKKLGFQLIAPLDVRIGIGKINISKNADYKVHSIWPPELLDWRLRNPSTNYNCNGKTVVASAGKFGIDAQLYSGDESIANKAHTNQKKSLIKLWIGIAKDKSENGFFVDLPGFLKSSPLNLIFKDLTGNLPQLVKEDFLFELIDFDAY